jgi:hypothetical protein
MKPLYTLTSGGKNIPWTGKHETMRQMVISILTDAAVLTIFDPSYPIELYTIASAEGYGAILMHKVGGKNRVIEYYSKRTSPTECRYLSYELETLAVVNAIKHFRHYLHGRKFLVVTDHNSYTFAISSKIETSLLTIIEKSTIIRRLFSTFCAYLKEQNSYNDRKCIIRYMHCKILGNYINQSTMHRFQ